MFKLSRKAELYLINLGLNQVVNNLVTSKPRKPKVKKVRKAKWSSARRKKFAQTMKKKWAHKH